MNQPSFIPSERSIYKRRVEKRRKETYARQHEQNQYVNEDKPKKKGEFDAKRERQRLRAILKNLK